jgi:hypothetical protein
MLTVLVPSIFTKGKFECVIAMPDLELLTVLVLFH